MDESKTSYRILIQHIGVEILFIIYQILNGELESIKIDKMIEISKYSIGTTVIANFLIEIKNQK